MSNWQPIETAPLNRYVLAWSEVDGCSVASYQGDGEWSDGRTDQCGDLILLEEVTHWMPLPDRP